MTEARRGGTSSGNTLPTGEPYPLNQDTERFDLGATFEKPLGNWGLAQLRASGTNQQHDHQFGTLLESDAHSTTLIEGSVTGDSAMTTWVTGLAYQADRYDSDAFPSFDYSYESPAVFGQLDRDINDQLSIAASARWDNHSDFGDQFSPRLSLQYRPGLWSIRASWGRGFYAPTPFIEETEATGLSRLEPLSELVAETAETVSLDVGYTSGEFETSLTLFGSAIEDAVRLEDAGTDRVRLTNQEGTTRTKGLEAMGRWRQGDFTITANYLYLDTREPVLDSPMNRAVPLTPTHSAGLVSIWEAENKGRVGLEVYYVGEQTLEDNPYRDESEPYIHVGLLGEMYLGRYRLFLNLENILDVRQTKEDPLLLPSQANNGRWTVDAWAPIDGFIANVGVRISL
nr:TonB-dependent receptor [Congregibacter litoralis]